MNKRIVEYISGRHKDRSEHSVFSHIPLIVKDPLEAEDTSAADIVDAIEETLPFAFLRNVEMIYIGDFPELTDRNAVYLDGAIYITNREPTIDDFLENIVHEVAHSLEESGDVDLYANSLKNEFLSKRLKLKQILDGAGYHRDVEEYLDIDFSSSFDDFLAQEIGYPELVALTMGLFVSPYGATSLKEYFANGFEHYIVDNPQLVKKISPILYNQIQELYE